MTHADGSHESRSQEGLLPLLGLALLTGVYFVLRYGGQWAESDTGTMAMAIRAVRESGQVAPNVDAVYGNGFGYQAVSLAIISFTGLSVVALQQLVYPLISTLLILPAWKLYRELTGSGRVASLATLLLLLVPEHLFAVLRGSHERLDRVFMLTTLWLLVRSLRFRGDRVTFSIHVGLVLLMTYGLIATNALFGMSFVVALLTALVLSWLARVGPAGVRHHAAETTRLLRWMSVATIVLVTVFVLFMYPPVGQSLRALSTIPGTLWNLIVTGGGGTNPYAGVLSAWVSPIAYLILSMADFLILGTSALVWLWLSVSWVRGRGPASRGIWMLWLLYAAFAAQGVAGVVSDRTGALQANVQYRAFSVFATMAAPLVAVALSRWHPRSWMRNVVVAAFAVMVMSALLKTTLDPAISNKWTFYTTAEIQGLRWADTHQRGADIWVGPDDRLPSAFALVIGNSSAANGWDSSPPRQGTQSFLLSDVIRLQSARLGITLPSVGARNLVYDNGAVQVYRSRPLGAFDR